MTTLQATTTVNARNSITDYPIGTDTDGNQIVATLTCWHDKDRKALLAQLQRFTIAANGTRTEVPGHSTRIESKMMAKFSKAALDGFTDYAKQTVDELRFSGNEDDSYAVAVAATFAPEA
jgi:hypothetical protein